MTSKTIVLRILDVIVVTFLGILALSLLGLPIGPRLFNMPSLEFHDFSMFIVVGAMWLMHAIATSDSAP